MKDILEFLNTSSVEELTKYPQISAEMAEVIIAARPINDREDSKRVKGFSFKKFDALKAALESEIAAAYAQTDEPVAEAKTDPEPEVKKASIGKILFRILIALLILGAIFSLVYFGVPWFKEKVLNPLQSNTERVSALTSQQAADMEKLSSDLKTLQERVATLEARADSIDQSIQTHSEALVKLDELQAALQTSLDSHKLEISSQVAEQLTLTRAIELLGRSRLYMSQSNFGLAKSDAASARDLLFGLLSTIAADQSNALKIVINRLDLALSNMESYPVIAVYDLDMAWRLLVDGLPNVPAMVITPVIAETLSPTAIPQATPTVTP